MREAYSCWSIFLRKSELYPLPDPPAPEKGTVVEVTTWLLLDIELYWLNWEVAVVGAGGTSQGLGFVMEEV